MKKFILIFLLLNYFFNNRSIAQTKIIHQLKIGDKMPDVELDSMMHYPSVRAKISDFKGKLIIFDQWNTYCSTCIEQFPKLWELQQRFGDKIQIILITNDKRMDVEDLWVKLKADPHFVSRDNIINAEEHLPILTDDSVLFRPSYGKIDSTVYFHRQIPGEEWIDTNQHVLSANYGASVTIEQIQAILDGKKVVFADEQNTENLLHFSQDADPSTWVNWGINVSAQLPYYSLFTKRIDYGMGGNNTNSKWKDSLSIGIKVINQSMLELYKIAYRAAYAKNTGMFLGDNNIVLKVDSPRQYLMPAGFSKYFNWANNYTFCYGIKLSSSNSEQDALQFMQQDIDRFFHFTSKIQTAKVKCLVLKRIGTQDKLRSRAKAANCTLTANTKTGIYDQVLKKENVGMLIEVLSSSYFRFYSPFTPMVDETNYKGFIDINFPSASGDFNPQEKIPFESLRKALNKYGLDLVWEYRARTMLVLTKSKQGYI